MSVDKSSVLKKLRESDAIYVLMSDCTRMPFVVCDPETYDDEVFIFFSEEDAMRGGQEFLKANNPLKIFNIEKKYLLPFYSSLFPIGVNCMVIGKGTEEEIAIQLGELVRRPEQKPGEEPIENPEFQSLHLYRYYEGNDVPLLRYYAYLLHYHFHLIDEYLMQELAILSLTL